MKIRSIGRDELDLFSSVSKDPEDFKEFVELLWDRNESCPEWCFLWEEDGKIIARVIYWSFPSDREETHISGLYLPWDGDYLEIGKLFLKKTLTVMYSLGVRTIDNRFTSKSYPHTEAVIELYEEMGMDLIQEKKRLVFKKDMKLKDNPQRLKFKTYSEVDETVTLGLVGDAMEKSLDRDDLFEIQKEGKLKAAQDCINTLKDINYQPDWWQIAYDTEENAVGFVFPQYLEEDAGAINYIGVIPQYRGKCYVVDLVMKATEVMLDNNIDININICIADIDSINYPMENGLLKAGYIEDSRIWVYKCELAGLADNI